MDTTTMDKNNNTNADFMKKLSAMDPRLAYCVSQNPAMAIMYNPTHALAGTLHPAFSRPWVSGRRPSDDYVTGLDHEQVRLVIRAGAFFYEDTMGRRFCTLPEGVRVEYAEHVNIRYFYHLLNVWLRGPHVPCPHCGGDSVFVGQGTLTRELGTRSEGPRWFCPACSKVFRQGGIRDWVTAIGEANIVREMTPVGWDPTDLLVKFFSMANPDYGSWNCKDSDPSHVMEWLAGRDREAREAFASGAPFQADLPLHGDKVAGVLQIRGREMTLMKYETVTEPAKTVGKRHYKPREKRVLVSVGPVDGTYDAVWGFWPTLQRALEMLPTPDKVETRGREAVL